MYAMIRQYTWTFFWRYAFSYLTRTCLVNHSTHATVHFWCHTRIRLFLFTLAMFVVGICIQPIFFQTVSFVAKDRAGIDDVIAASDRCHFQNAIGILPSLKVLRKAFVSKCSEKC